MYRAGEEGGSGEEQKIDERRGYSHGVGDYRGEGSVKEGRKQQRRQYLPFGSKAQTVSRGLVLLLMGCSERLDF